MWYIVDKRKANNWELTFTQQMSKHIKKHLNIGMVSIQRHKIKEMPCILKMWNVVHCWYKTIRNSLEFFYRKLQNILHDVKIKLIFFIFEEY